MKEQGHTMIIQRDESGIPQVEVRHPPDCPFIKISFLGADDTVQYECTTGHIVAANGVEDISGWDELPDGNYSIAVETEPSDWPGATDAYLVLIL